MRLTFRHIMLRSPRSVVAAIALASLASFGPPQVGRESSPSVAAQTARPNIIFYMTDDQDVETLRFMPRV
ncbi:MAG TPA: hypothetical protein VGK54_09620, partial [Chloroflexota bacterium]